MADETAVVTPTTGERAAGSVEAAETETGRQAEIRECKGCAKPVTTFSGERSFCLRCTEFIIENDIARRDFAAGCLLEIIETQKTLDEWAE